MSFGYLGDTSTKIKQVKKNDGVISIAEAYDLEKLGHLGGSLQLIAETTASSSTIDFVDKFTGFDIHKIELINCVPTTQTEFGIRFSNDSGSSYETTNYQFANQRQGSVSERRSTSQATIRLGGDVTTGSTEGFNGYFYIYNANNSAKYTFITGQFTFLQSTTYLAEFGGGVYAQAETVNGIRIAQQTSATVFTSGTAKLFGVKQI